LEAAVTVRDTDDPPRPSVGVTPDRIIAISPPARAVHRAILLGFVDAGHPPTADTLAAAAGPHDLTAVLSELHGHDIICLDDRGAIRAAYPFSARPTAHVVEIQAGPTVYAMCAIDALGMAAMLDRDVVIRSTDPRNGLPVTVTVYAESRRRPVWTPRTAVVYVGAFTAPVTTAGSTADTGVDGDRCYPTGSASCDAATPAADQCCTVMNFFTGPDSAAQWQAGHLDVTGTVLDQQLALKRGVGIFGHLLKG
jgi:hypothetical protein